MKKRGTLLLISPRNAVVTPNRRSHSSVEKIISSYMIFFLFQFEMRTYPDFRISCYLIDLECSDYWALMTFDGLDKGLDLLNRCE